MKQTIKQIKIGEIVQLIQRLGIAQDTLVNLTIETLDDDILTVFDQIGKEAQDKGLTQEKLEELLLEKDYREQKLNGFLTDFQTDELTLEEITQEVEAVRQEIYIQTQADV